MTNRRIPRTPDQRERDQWRQNKELDTDGKIPSVPTATADNLASFNTVGNVKDSGLASALVLLIADVLGTAAQITVTDNGDGTISISIPDLAEIKFANTGLKIFDTDDSNTITIQINEDLTDERIISILTGDGDRTLSLLADLYIESDSTINQDVTTDASPTFGGGTINGKLLVDQNADAIGIEIDSEATTLESYGLQVVTGQGAIAARFVYGTDAEGSFLACLPNNSGYVGNFFFVRDLAAADTDSAVVYMLQENAGDTQPLLELKQDGTGPALLVTSGSINISAGVTISTGVTVPDDGFIGSESDPDAIAIAADGDVTFSQGIFVTDDIEMNGHILFDFDNSHIGYFDNSPILIFNNTDDRSEFIGDVTISTLTASRLMYTSATGLISSVADLTSWIAGTANRVTVTDDLDGTVTLNLPQDIHTGSTPQFTNLILTGYARIGTGTTFESFYQDEGDIYSETGKLYLGKGINTRCERYGVGLQVREYNPSKNLQYAVDATFTAATATILKAGETFLTDGVAAGDFLVLTDANDTAYIGSTGEILSVTETEIVVSLAASGATTPDDLTGVDFIVFNEPLFSVLDNGDIHSSIGESSFARFKISSPYGNNIHAIRVVAKAGIDNHAALAISIDADTNNEVYGTRISYDATAFASAETIGAGHNLIIDNTGASAGDIHGLEMSLADPSNTDLEAEVIAAYEGVGVAGQYLATAATLAVGYVYDDSGAAYTDRTTEFGSSASDVQIFVEVDDQILLGSLAKWDFINVALQVNSSQSILPTFEYIEADGTWTAFTPTDETTGFKRSGTIRWDKDNLTDWGQRTVNEVTGDVGAVDYYWIRITRTRATIGPNLPTEDTISIQTAGAKFYWDANGDVFVNSLAITDGIAAPDTIAGQAITYIDSADGDYKIKFGDGTVKTIATDT